MKKIKNFYTTEPFSDEKMETLENRVNEFAHDHNVIDVKTTTSCNSFGWLVLHTVIYED